MSRKNSGWTGFLSVFISVSLILLTVTFSEPLVNVTGNAGKGFLLFLSEYKGFGSGNSENKTVFSFENSIKGFGSGNFTLGKTSDTSIPRDVEKIMNEAVPVYKNLEKTGEIEETLMQATSNTVEFGNVLVNNKTETKKIDIKKELSKKPKFGEISTDEPYILIYHTHTTEGYELLDKGWYSDDYNSRTKDEKKSVVRVGEEIAKRLEMAGFKVIHDKTIYDESYNGAYSRSLVTVEKYLKKYPSIVVTLDVHRDAIHYDDGTRCKPTATINGKKAAQIMIITGAEEGSVENFPGWSDNLTFAVALQNKVEEKYKGLMRPVFFCQRKYNMHVTPCSLLLEMGTDANTLDEAVYSGRLVGDSLAELLEENM